MNLYSILRLSNKSPTEAVDSIVSKVSANPDKLLYLLNTLRAEDNHKPLTIDKTLTQIAIQHSKDQAKQGKMTHEGSDSSDVESRADSAGYRWRSIAENVAYNQKSELEVTQAWMNSPGHRANMLSDKYDNVGFGYYQGYWTEDFGTLM
ncbi:SCP-domain-containing protein [Conidiobolus coronatus NRRL 28638]|uniref:SCP-domain-containing protein n=1 Tax=Conidiobolus coronatus (strain ATCC 28846 / CBS 209.66 / NRRL 28638) TaxID=796925 RepID=A0A137NV94_CONC2|nr:SCP-domain-containing protein [Conidiobolus coronatus NRRL 28638]|eukprot:KXN66551.1 SCP-domain-containing protein [Conidiobolus coronatus NRRL 28638]